MLYSATVRGNSESEIQLLSSKAKALLYFMIFYHFLLKISDININIRLYRKYLVEYIVCLYLIRFYMGLLILRLTDQTEGGRIAGRILLGAPGRSGLALANAIVNHIWLKKMGWEYA